MSDDMISSLLRGQTPAKLGRPDKNILRYARKLTAQPWTVTEEDVQELRASEFSDKAILQINLVVDYFNFVNRLASGLGVELEPYWSGKEKQ